VRTQLAGPTVARTKARWWNPDDPRLFHAEGVRHLRRHWGVLRRRRHDQRAREYPHAGDKLHRQV